MYIVLFGRLLIRKSGEETGQSFKIALGATLAEESLFEDNGAELKESATADRESCVLSVKTSFIKDDLGKRVSEKDFLIVESTFKGNYLRKQEWRNTL